MHSFEFFFASKYIVKTCWEDSTRQDLRKYSLLAGTFRMTQKCTLWKILSLINIAWRRNFPLGKAPLKMKLICSTKSPCSKNSITLTSSSTMIFTLKGRVLPLFFNFAKVKNWVCRGWPCQLPAEEKSQEGNFQWKTAAELADATPYGPLTHPFKAHHPQIDCNPECLLEPPGRFEDRILWVCKGVRKHYEESNDSGDCSMQYESLNGQRRSLQQ